MCEWIVQEVCGHTLANIDCSTWTHTLTFCCWSPCQRYGASGHGTQIGAWAWRWGGASTFHLTSTITPRSASEPKWRRHQMICSGNVVVTAVLFISILSSRWFTVFPEPCWPSTHTRWHLHNVQCGCAAAPNPIKAMKSKARQLHLEMLISIVEGSPYPKGYLATCLWASSFRVSLSPLRASVWRVNWQSHELLIGYISITHNYSLFWVIEQRANGWSISLL